MGEATLHYRIAPTDPGAHLYEVRLRVAQPEAAGQRVRLPAWIPGSYMIRDYARHVVAMRAYSVGGERGRRAGRAGGDGEALPLTKLDKSTWKAPPVEGAIEFVYEVYAWDLSVRGAHLDTTHAYFNGACVFVEALAQAEAPMEVEIAPPPRVAGAGRSHAVGQGDEGTAGRSPMQDDTQAAAARPGVGEGWTVATSLTPVETDDAGYGRYRARDYAELIDHPVEIAALERGSFDVLGIPHRVAVRGARRFDMARLTRDMATVCAEHHRLLGAPGDLDRYQFLVIAQGEGYGGLEHRWSSSLICKRTDLPLADTEAGSDAYRKFLGLVSHEYFHLWNVTRMKPAAFTPHDLRAEAHTGLLWVFEGITSYYDDLALIRSGLIDAQSYLELVGRNVTTVWRTPGRFRQSLELSSFDAWTKLYQRDENAPNSIVSYYTKGALVALALDLRLRTETADVTLDGVMRECWRLYGESGRGMPERGLEAVAAKMSGLPLESFFERYVRGTDDPPLADLLARVGVRFHLRVAESGEDKGGKPADGKRRPRPWLGAKLAQNGQALGLESVLAGGPLERAGVAAGDELVALDGLRVTAGSLAELLGRYQPGNRVRLEVFRRDELASFEVELAEPPADTCYLVIDDKAAEEAQALRRAWLGPQAPPEAS